MHSHTHTYTNTHTYIHVCTHTHLYTHTHTHIHTHSHTHKASNQLLLVCHVNGRKTWKTTSKTKGHKGHCISTRTCAGKHEDLHYHPHLTPTQDRQKRGSWGSPSCPTFCGKICHYSKSSQSALECHASLVPCDD